MFAVESVHPDTVAGGGVTEGPVTESILNHVLYGPSVCISGPTYGAELVADQATPSVVPEIVNPCRGVILNRAATPE